MSLDLGSADSNGMVPLTLAAQFAGYVVGGRNIVPPDEIAIATAINSVQAAINRGITSPYLSQATWFIDPVNGKDTNSGVSQGNALQTFLEFGRRVRNGTIATSMLVTVLSTPIATDRPELVGVCCDRFDHVLRIKGIPVFGTAQPALTAVTAINHAVADGALYLTAGAAPWTAGSMYVIVGGARDGAVGWCAKDMGAGQGRFTAFTLIPDGTQGFMSSAMKVAPQIGDVLKPVTLCTFNNPLSLLDVSSTLIWENFRFNDDSAFTGQGIFCDNDNSMTFTRCDLRDSSFIIGGVFPAFNSCACDLMFTGAGADGALLASLVRGVGQEGIVGAWRIGFDTIFQNAYYDGGDFALGQSTIGDCGFYDLTNAGNSAMTSRAGTVVQLKPFLSGDSGTQYGIGVAGFSVQAIEGGQFQVATAANLRVVGVTNLYKRDSDNGSTIPTLPNSVGSNITLGAASAVSTSVSQSADTTTNSAVLVDFTGMSITITPRCSKVRVSFMVTGDADAAADVTFQVRKDAAQATDVNGGGKAQTGLKVSGANDTRHGGWVGFVACTPNTATTFKIQWKTSAGNARVNANTNGDHSISLIVEEIPYT